MIIIYILLFLNFNFSLYYLLTILQQEHYQLKAFIKYFIPYYLKTVLPYLYALVATLSIFPMVIHRVIIAMLLIVGLLMYPKLIIKLRWTARIKRFYCFAIIVTLAYAYFTNCLICYTSYLMLLPIGLILLFYAIYPLEVLINHNYSKKAIKKLKQMPNLLKIAITGSYGKSTTKMILRQLLEPSYLTLATPKSYNTYLGLVMSINDSLNVTSEVFISEMGMNHLGEIAKMSHLIEPKIAVITEIGPQHLATMQTVERVLAAKMEIVSPSVECLIINADNDALLAKSLTIPRIDLFTYGVVNETANLVARDIQYSLTGTTFKCYYNQVLLGEFTTPLLGKHNVSNILASIGVLIKSEKYGIKYDLINLKANLTTLKGLDNRLQWQKRGIWDVLDDSYNSNIQGFSNALEILKLSQHNKFIITPGIVDNGKYNDELNLLMVQKMREMNANIYLIKNQATHVMLNYLIECEYERYLVFDSYQAAYTALLNRYQKERICLLIANDLPDNYLRR